MKYFDNKFRLDLTWIQNRLSFQSSRQRITKILKSPFYCVVAISTLILRAKRSDYMHFISIHAGTHRNISPENKEMPTNKASIDNNVPISNSNCERPTLTLVSWRLNSPKWAPRRRSISRNLNDFVLRFFSLNRKLWFKLKWGSQ